MYESLSTVENDSRVYYHIVFGINITTCGLLAGTGSQDSQDCQDCSLSPRVGSAFALAPVCLHPSLATEESSIYEHGGNRANPLARQEKTQSV